MIRWEPGYWCLIGSAALWLMSASWRATELCAFRSPGFVTKETKGAGGQIRKYVLYVPPEHDGRRPLPAIVFLHGEGEVGFDGRQQLKTGLAPEISRRQRSDRGFPYFVFFPQSECPWSDDAANLDIVMKVLAEALDEFSIDADRIYLTGILSGGDGVLRLAAAYPDRWAAIVPISCGSSLNEVKRVRSLPIRWYQTSSHGIEGARECIAAVSRAGNSAELIEFHDLSLDAWTRAYADPGLYDWLRRHCRRRRASF